MSIEHLKKQSRNLKKLLPDFIRSHPNGEAPLAQIQELIARSSGYPSWHAAVSSRIEQSYSNQQIGAIEGIGIDALEADLYMDGHELGYCRKFASPQSKILFRFIDRDLYGRLEGELVAFIEKTSSDLRISKKHATNEDLEKALASTLIAKCRSMLAEHPNFIGAAAYLSNCLSVLDKHNDLIDATKPIFDDLCSILPGGFSGFHGIMEAHQEENDQFFIIAYHLVRAYILIDNDYGDARASSIVAAMLIWCPSEAERYSRIVSTLVERRYTWGKRKRTLQRNRAKKQRISEA